jgi:hypothetical protein
LKVYRAVSTAFLIRRLLFSLTDIQSIYRIANFGFSISPDVVYKLRTRHETGRPFVRLGDGRLALIDTGSGFGLAVSDGRVVSKNHNQQDQVIRDLAGGSISARRVDPVTVNIGALELKSVPTDFLFGAPAGTPVIIGRDALYPFRLTFDPTSRLIEIAPVQ